MQSASRISTWIPGGAFVVRESSNCVTFTSQTVEPQEPPRRGLGTGILGLGGSPPMMVHNALSCRRQRAAGSCRIQTPIPRFPASNGACHSPVSGIGQMGPCPRWIPTWTRPRLTLFAWPLKNFFKTRGSPAGRSSIPSPNERATILELSNCRDRHSGGGIL